MNREYIYRIWDLHARKYVMTGSLYGCEGIAGLSQYFNRLFHKIEEYTGLEDKDGEKIFEGDIIQFTARYRYANDPVEVIFFGGSYGCIIVMENGTKEFWHLKDIVVQSYPKVIGNINQLPCKPDHNGECLVCDCWLSDCPLIKKNESSV